MAHRAETISTGNAPASTAPAVEPGNAALLESLLNSGQSPGAVVGGKPGAMAYRRGASRPPGRSSTSCESADVPVKMGAEERIQLIQSCQGVVRSLAWKIHRKLPPSIDLDDLIAYGQVGLAQAARDFDPAVGGKFTTYAYWRVRGAILDGLSQMSWFKRHDFHASKYEPPPESPPDIETIAKVAPVTEPENPADARQDRQRLTMASIGSESATEADFTGAGLVEDVATKPPPTQSMMREMMDHVRKSIELLPPESASLIRAAYFEGVTLHEAGRRLGISRAWTSRLHAKALERLKRELRSHWAGE